MADLHIGEQSGEKHVPDFYALLRVAPDASRDDILVAYKRQLALYDPAQAAALGDDFVAVAEERRAALDEAVAVLQDPRRSFAYDRQLGLVGDETTDRRGVSNREVMYAVGGVLAALLILAALWSALGRQPRTGPAISEVNYPAPPFSLRTLDGGRFDLAAHRVPPGRRSCWSTSGARGASRARRKRPPSRRPIASWRRKGW